MNAIMGIDQIHVLVVDDDPSEAELLRDYFHDGDGSLFEVTLVETLAAGHRKLQEEGPFDVILLDPELPDSRDSEAYGVLEGQSQGAPVILMAGPADELSGSTWSSSSADQQERLLDSGWISWAIQYALARKRLEKIFPPGSRD